MTVADIERASADEVRAFIDSFALRADLKDPAHVDLLHAAKSKFMGAWARKVKEEAQAMGGVCVTHG